MSSVIQNRLSILQMIKFYHVFLLVFVLSIVTPYITVVFFHYKADVFLSLLLFLLSFLLLITSTLFLRKLDYAIGRRKYYGWIAVTAVIFFFLSYGSQLELADRLFFKSREQKLTVLITQIQAYGRIKEMSDGLRYWKTINGTAVEQDSSKIGKESDLNKKYLLDDILRRDKIDKSHYNSFKDALIHLNLISFTTLPDGTISFTIDGFLDNCQGIAYSATGNHPARNDCGDVIRWVKISENWYSWGST